MINQCGEQCTTRGEVHPVDSFHILDNLKNEFASITFCRNLEACKDRNVAVIELSVVVSIGEVPRH